MNSKEGKKLHAELLAAVEPVLKKYKLVIETDNASVGGRFTWVLVCKKWELKMYGQLKKEGKA